MHCVDCTLNENRLRVFLSESPLVALKSHFPLTVVWRPNRQDGPSTKARLPMQRFVIQYRLATIG